MTYLNTIPSFFLSFSHYPLLFLFAFITAACKGPQRFFQLTSLVAFDIVLNVALKGTFKIPLSPALGKFGYAFPSGHMQMSTCFYLYLAIVYQSWFIRTISMLILIGIGHALIYFGFHNLTDVLGGVTVGLLLVLTYCYLTTYTLTVVYAVLLPLASILVIYSLWVYAHAPAHTWSAYFGLLLSACLHLAMNHPKTNHLFTKCFCRDKQY